MNSEIVADCLLDMICELDKKGLYYESAQLTSRVLECGSCITKTGLLKLLESFTNPEMPDLENIVNKYFNE